MQNTERLIHYGTPVIFFFFSDLNREYSNKKSLFHRKIIYCEYKGDYNSKDSYFVSINLFDKIKNVSKLINSIKIKLD